MTDVRLTALNPEDSTVVPVACNSSGELLVDKGEPVGPDLNVEGDLSVGGSITAAGSGRFAGDRIGLNADGTIETYRSSGNADSDLQAWQSDIGGIKQVKARIKADGSGTFKGDVAIGGSTTFRGTLGDAVALLPPSIAEQFETIISSLPVAQPFTGDATTLPADIPTPLKNALVRVTTAGKINLNADGSASFSSIKAGFTAEGELIFTSRNARYKLVVSDGFLFPEPYTREMELKEKLERKD